MWREIGARKLATTRAGCGPARNSPRRAPIFEARPMVAAESRGADRPSHSRPRMDLVVWFAAGARPAAPGTERGGDRSGVPGGEPGSER